MKIEGDVKRLYAGRKNKFYLIGFNNGLIEVRDSRKLEKLIDFKIQNEIIDV